MENGECRIQNREWRMENGAWSMEHGAWSMEHGELSVLTFNHLAKATYYLVNVLNLDSVH